MVNEILLPSHACKNESVSCTEIDGRIRVCLANPQSSPKMHLFTCNHVSAQSLERKSLIFMKKEHTIFQNYTLYSIHLQPLKRERFLTTRIRNFLWHNIEYYNHIQIINFLTKLPHITVPYPITKFIMHKCKHCPSPFPFLSSALSTRLINSSADSFCEVMM
jgi:hypothetical protein